MRNTSTSICRNRPARMTSRPALQFWGDERGTITVESVIVLPIIFVILTSTFVWFESYRRSYYTLKANISVADFLSRVDDVDSTTMNGLDRMFQYMSKTGSDSWVRFTMVKCDSQCNSAEDRILSCVLSTSTGTGGPKHSTASVRTHLDQYIPLMFIGQEVIVVETAAKYVPPLSGSWTKIFARDLTDITVTAPRETTTVTWSGDGSGACAS